MAGFWPRLATTVLGPIDDHPFRAAAGIAAMLAAAVIWVGSTTTPTGGGDHEPATADALLAFALAHPAYPAAVLFGVGVVLFAR